MNVVSINTGAAYVAPPADPTEPQVTHYNVTSKNVGRLRRVISENKRSHLDVGDQVWIINDPTYQCRDEGGEIMTGDGGEVVLTRTKRRGEWEDEDAYGPNHGTYWCAHDDKLHHGCWHPTHGVEKIALVGFLPGPDFKVQVIRIGVDGYVYEDEPEKANA